MRNSWTCVDANLVLRLVADPADTFVRQLWENWVAERRQLAAPTLLYYEVSNALYRYQRHGLMSVQAVQMALMAALALPLRLFGDANLHRQAIELADRLSLPVVYDAHYLALAERLGAEFWTGDQRLVQAVQETLPRVHLVKA